MSRACVCGGSNENCRFCAGLGTIPDTLATALISHVGRPESEYISPGAAPPRPKWMGRRTPGFQIPCPEACGALLNPRKVGRHLERIHGIGPASSQQFENPTQTHLTPNVTGRTYESCPKCGVKVRADRVNKHITKAHQNDLMRPPIVRAYGSAHAGLAGCVRKMHEAKTSASGPTRSRISQVYTSPYPAPQQIQTSVQSRSWSEKSAHKYELCSVCKAKVRVDRIQKHMVKVHKRRFVGPRAVVAPSSKDPLRQSTSLVAPRDKNLDATKLYAHPCRERGRYGSHPSHDGFDDESSPD